MMRTRWFALLAWTISCALLLAACSGSDNTATPEPGETDDPGTITLKMVKRGYTDVHPPADQLWMWQKYEEISGIHVEFEELAGSAVTERKM